MLRFACVRIGTASSLAVRYRSSRLAAIQHHNQVNNGNLNLNLNLMGQKFRLFSDDAEGDADSPIPKFTKEEKRRLDEAQAAKVKAYKEEVNERRKQYAEEYAAKQAALEAQKEEERKLFLEEKAIRDAAKAQRKAENIVRIVLGVS